MPRVRAACGHVPGCGAVAALTLALALAAGAPVRAALDDPYQRYRAAHPEVGEEDLLEVSRGDALDRVLAVVHHPHLGVDPVRVQAFELDGPTLLPASLAELLGAPPPPLPVFLSVQQRCTRPPPEAEEPIFSSWFLFRGGALRAFSLEVYGEDCAAGEPLVEAFDHEDMRVVGQGPFRHAGAGRFRYGSLLYERWDDAFAEPTREAMLSRLEAARRAAPDDAEALNRLAVGLYAVGERDRALALLQRAAALAPGWAVVHRNLAVAHVHRGDLTAARAARARADALGANGASASPPES